MNSNRKTFYQRFFQSRLFIIVEVITLILITTALGKEIVRKHQVETQVKDLQEELALLEGQKSDLAGLIKYFDSDVYKEEQARLKLGLQKPGESVVAVLGESTSKNNSLPADASNDISENLMLDNSNPKRWLNYFF